MSKPDSQTMMERMLEGMRDQLTRDEADGKLAGITVADLADAMSHPKAAVVVAECMEAEAGSVQPGTPAPDFTLPWLPGAAKPGSDALRLSSHFGRRPVALVFGSYT